MPSHFIRCCCVRFANKGVDQIQKLSHAKINPQSQALAGGLQYLGQQSNQSYGTSSNPPSGETESRRFPGADQPHGFYWAYVLQGLNHPAEGGSSSFYQARMEKKKFRSQMVKVYEQKSMFAFIDSRATHNFLHSKSNFWTYEIIEPEIVQAAHRKTTLTAKGTVLLPIGKGNI